MEKETLKEKQQNNRTQILIEMDKYECECSYCGKSEPETQYCKYTDQYYHEGCVP